MCRHTAAPMFPAPDTDARRRLWAVRALDVKVRCTACGLTGRLRDCGRVKWHYEGSVGFADVADLERAWEEAGEQAMAAG